MIVFQEKKLCENCFSTVTSDRCESCGFSAEAYSPDPTVLAVGSVLQNRYRIGGIIGKGGFGITYIAFDTKLERRIAIKEYFPYGLALRSTENMSVMTTGDADVFKKGAEKFYDEARLIAKFNSSGNIVNVYDVFYENDTVYYAMEYLQGQTLKAYIENGNRLTSGQAVYIAEEIAGALDAAHEMNVLHRDISPDNIMLCPDNKVKLIDFGAARQVISEGSQNMSVILTQGFAPFEQYQKKGKQGPWTDIYSLGASLYYGLTGVIIDDPMSRFEDDSAFQANSHSIEGEMWEIIRKAVMVRSGDRYQSAAELKDALEAISIRPEKIVIPKGEVKVKVSTATVTTGIASEQQPSMSANMSSQMQTMPVSQSSQMRTMPVSQSSQMRTMPVSESSQMRTMAVNEVQQLQTGNYESNDKPKKKNRIPIIAGIASGFVLLAAIIVIAVNSGSSDEDVITADESVTETTTVSETEEVTEKETETEEVTEKETEEVTTTTTPAKPEEPEKPENTPPETEAKPKETAPSQNGRLEVKDNNLKLSFEIPNGYEKQSDSTDTWLSYLDQDTGSEITLALETGVTNYPICSYKDMPELIEYYLDSTMNGTVSNISSDYTVIAGRNAWACEFYLDHNGNTYDCMYVFCDSETKYGCYAFYVDCLKDDEETMDACIDFLNSITINGSPNELFEDWADIYRGDLGVNFYNVSADVGFFYSAPGCTLEGGNGEALYIRTKDNGFVEIFVNDLSMESYCNNIDFDKNNIMTTTYGGNTFDYIIKDSYYGYKWNYTLKMKSKGHYITIEVNTSDEDLTWTLENNILPSIHAYD